ncbi:MAG TPA: SRPBCC domain-containing protein [Leptospiraceae bacterium]|nr:SRPBCC domain-containing protein [Leptospiraceae bacterium]HMW04301.1 SRPBCC domain-containing protein [Leptospiraceae bacterium]HMX30647.1 SRPBCC domain-containing protein [Leptospiraceae bacterium]HMY31347.1 SRPBCC domain-containing protein [Leptospiraceae bacterium]HMZ63616.1 SRPBCC domain-containing protein [Leptospiraceae bacterium]
MSKSIQFTTSVEINANVEKIWNLFMDTSKYSEWNPFIKRVYGEIAPEKTILEFAYFYNHLYLPILMKIIEFENKKKITWVGNFPGFSDHHVYEFQEINNSKTVFSHAATFSGFFAISSKKHIETDVKRVHEEMNLALKKRAEN